MVPAAEFEAFKAKARALAEGYRAEIGSQQERIAELEEQAAGKRYPPCRACGGELACPQCYRGGGGEDY